MSSSSAPPPSANPIVPQALPYPSLIYLITGAQGFVGAWIIKHLIATFKSNVSIIAFDLLPENRILKQILSDEEITQLVREYGDVSDTTYVINLVSAYQPTHIIHLAGLQIPTCRVNPPLGAKVNVLGTVNVFEAAAKIKPRVKNIIYASSAAMCGPTEDYSSNNGTVPEDFNHKPRTHYGVYKLANEGNARIYWQDQQIPSVGLRPLTVFGVGREVGMTSGPTKAIKAAILGRSFDLTFTGETSFNDVSDVARLFVLASQKCESGAIAAGIKGVVTTVETFMATVEKVFPEIKGKYKITSNAVRLPFPSESVLHSLSPQTHIFEEENLKKLFGGEVPVSSLEESVDRMIKLFKSLLAEGKLDDKDLV